MDFGKKKMGGDALGNGRLLQEIEAIHRALYRDGNPVKPSRSISAGKTHQQFPPENTKSRALREATSSSSAKEKKSSSSIWNWKPLRALSSHVRNRRFNCSFSLHVHSVEALPSTFDGVSLRVHWKRRDGGLETRPAMVFQGIAEFEETLVHNCMVYGTRSGPHHSAKYEAKHFLLFVEVVGNAELDLGKQRIDLTRLLPLTLEELEEEKSSGKWSTSFKLSGRAKGAILNVSFGFVVLGDRKVSESSTILKQSQSGMTKSLVGLEPGDGKVSLRRVGSLQGSAGYRAHHSSRSVEDVKILHEVLPSSKSDVTSSLTCENISLEPEFHHFTHKELNVCQDTEVELTKENCENANEEVEFNVIEQGIEIDEKGVLESKENQTAEKEEETVNLHEVGKVMDGDVKLKDAVSPDQTSIEKSNMPTAESVMEDLDAALRDLSIFEADELESSPSQKSNYSEIKSGYKAVKVGKSLSLDDITESVASDFLNMLGIEHSPFGLSSDSDPESPRERLWKQFKKDTLASGEDVFGIGIGKEIGAESASEAPVQFDLGEFSKDYELFPISHAANTEDQMLGEAAKSKTRAKMLEDLETEALMREWGLNEKAFRSSPPNSASGFGSPIDLPPEEPLGLFPLGEGLFPLGEGLGPCLQTKDGGFLRSMNPSLFGNAKNNASLIMQVSSPVVVPAEMGSGIMEILQHLASVGIEKLSVQASKLMPLEDITGKTMQQVAWEAAPSLEAREREDVFLELDGKSADAGNDFFHGRKKGKNSKPNLSSVNGDTSSEYVSLEDLAPLAMEKIEALSVEGLKIQSGMSDQEAPSNICPQSIGEISALEGMKARSGGLLGLEGTAGMQLLDIKDSNEDVDGLMSLSLSLDEWMKLDAGVVDEEDSDNSRTSKILAAHRANCTAKDLINGRWKGDDRGRKSRKCGLLGNNFTVALMVQLRDPLRNYEPVGTPMLALIQVERVFVPPKPKVYHNVSIKGNSEEVDEPEPGPAEAKEEKKEEEAAEVAEVVPQFKITEVHVAGIKTEPTKKKLWGSSTQQQSGSRWLLASGMGKSNKPTFLKSKGAIKSPQVATTTVQPGETLWSISSRVHGTGAKWKELAALNPHIRNPNVIFPNETIRLR